ncbi:MAG: PaREP1 family protein [Chloroflexi bacterium]|nr:PaREP1 family protein [Chloroflexota bacterium]
MTTTGNNAYIKRSRRYLAQSEEELERGDLLQASEKGWAAASQILKAVAEERGWRHRNHNDLYKAIDLAVGETNDLELRFLFNTASELHANFYEEFMSATAVRENITGVVRFVEKVEGLLSDK